MQFAQAVRGKADAYKHRRRNWHEVLDVAQGDLKWIHILADAFDQCKCLCLCSAESSGRKDTDMRRQMSVCRMQFAAEMFNKLSDSVADVGDEGVLALFCHEAPL
jgi:hypothetical protein